jgi:hypothetical protein
MPWLADAYKCGPSQESARPVDITAAQIINPADPCDGKDQKACDADDQVCVSLLRHQQLRHTHTHKH